MNKLTKILAVVVTCLAIGYFSGTVTRSAIIDWYPTLVKPVLIPELISLRRWSMLYIMMGNRWTGLGSYGLDKEAVKKALILFVIQLWR
jgi:tryptophan-rich sensory protein